MKALTLALVTASLAGCASISYITQHYRGIPPVEIATAHDTFRVFDKPGDGRIMVTASLAAAAGQGFVGGLMLNPAVAASPKPVYQEAAERYLAATGRQCRISDGYLLIEPQWEFRYSCDGVGAVAAGASTLRTANAE